MMVRLIIASILAWCWGTLAYAAPDTIVDPALTIYGSDPGGRFGASVSCSTASANTDDRSYVAIGAPLADVGAHSEAGKVYIYDPTTTPVLLQTISSQSPGASRHFGRAVAFIGDANGDNVDDLVVGEPDENAATGRIHVYLSQLASPPYVYHNSFTPSPDIQGFGATLTALRSYGGSEIVVVVGAPQADRILSVVVNPITLAVSSSSMFAAAGNPGDRTGHSISEMWNGLTDLSSASDMLIGLPEDNTDQGLLLSIPQNMPSVWRRTGAPGDRLGFGVAGTHAVLDPSVPQPAIFKAWSIPGDNQVQIATGSAYANYCTVSVPMSDIPLESGTTLAHLQGSFLTLLDGADDGSKEAQDTTFVAYRTEADTGGSLSIFGTHGLAGCTNTRQINNCLWGAQEQGFAVTGGGPCSLKIGATTTAMLIAGSPAWDSGTGLISVYYDDNNHHAAPQACNTPTPTATPTSTPTLTPTHTPTFTPVPPTGSTPEGTRTPTEGAETGPNVVVIEPGAALPALQVIREGLFGTVIVPVFSFTQRFLLRIRFLAKLRSLVAAEQLARRETFAMVTVTAARATAGRVAAATLGQGKKKRTVRKWTTRRDRVTLRNLAPGQYEVRLRFRTTIKDKRTGKTRTFWTKSSPPTAFTQP